MANTVIALKKSATPSAAPTNLANGELAINYADGKLFYKAANGTISSISGNEPNYFGTVNANNTLVIADTPGDIFTIAAGKNIDINGDAVNDKLIVSLTNDVTVPGLLSVTAASGDEGGEIRLANAITNSLLSGPVNIDIFRNQLRFFVAGGDARGAFINLAATSAGVGTDLLAAATSTDTIARATASQAFDKANAALPNVSGTWFNGTLTASQNLVADKIISTNNGDGENFKVGDDAWIGDTNLANALRIKGQQNSSIGYVMFGTNDGKLLGRAGTDSLTYDGNILWHAGNSANASQAFDKANTANITADRAWNHANAAFANGNTTIQTAQSAFTQANLAFIHANAAFASANAGQATANAGQSTANAAFNRANTANITADRAWNHANAAFASANIAFANANTVMISAQAAFTVANSGFIHANAVYAFANSISITANLAFAHANAAFANGNTVIQTAQSAFTQANLAFIHANNAFASANAGQASASAAFNTANTANITADRAWNHANAAFITANIAFANANTVMISAQAAFTVANSSFLHSNAAYAFANSITITANLAFAHANAAHATANAAFDKANSTTYTSNVVISVTDDTNAALRITQTGTGHAILVEDSSNPDSTPFVVSNTGVVGIGTSNVAGFFPTLTFGPSANVATLRMEASSTQFPIISMYGATGSIYGIGQSTSQFNPGLGFRAYRSRGNTTNVSNVSSGDYTSSFLTLAHDGISYRGITNIIHAVETFNGANDVSGYITFVTRPTGFDGIAAERLRISGNGNVTIGRTDSTVGSGVKLDIAGAANASNLLVNGNMVFTHANDGSGSNLDADLLDGQHGSYYGIATDVTAAFAHANAAFANANTVMVSAQAAFTVANSSFLHTNAAYSFANSIAITANLAFAHANSAYANGNIVIQTAQSAFTQANLAFIHANNAFASANAGQASGNAAQSTANAAFNRANTANITADRAWNHANAAFASANIAFANANTVMVSAQAAFTVANSSFIHANAGYAFANSISITANLAFVHANAAFANANTVMISAQSAFTVANSGFLHANSGYAFANSIAITANLAFAHANAAFANGNTVIQTAQSAFTLANNAYLHSNAAHASANAGMSIANGAFASANAGQATANAAFNRANNSLLSSSYTAADVLAKLITVDGAGTTLDADLLDGQQGTYYGIAADVTAAFNKANTANITADRAWNHANAAFASANIAFANANTVMVSAQAAFTVANSGFIHANSGYAFANSIAITANLAFAHANLAFANGNTVIQTAQSAFNQANLAFIHANNAFASANAGQASGNAAQSTANAAFNRANTANITADRAWNHANAAFDKANNALPLTGGTVTGSIVLNDPQHQLDIGSGRASVGYIPYVGYGITTPNTGVQLSLYHPSGSIIEVNQAGIGLSSSLGSSISVSGNVTPAAGLQISPVLIATSGKNWYFSGNGHILFPDSTKQYTAFSNSYITTINAAFAHANAAFLSSNGVNTYTNSTYVKLTASSQTITGDVNIVGALTLSGNTVFIDATRLEIDDPLIYLAGNNYTSDIVDIGFIANYVNATGQNVHTGLYREHENKEYYLFQGYDKEPANNHIGAFSNNMTLAVLNADIKTSNIILGGANAIVTIGASFNHANAAHASANAGMVIANGAFASANAGQSTANAAFNRANTANITADRAWNHANAAFATANIAFANANTVMISAQAAFTVANSGFIHANAAFATVNSAFATINVAFANANTVMISAQAAFTVANAAFLHANAAFIAANADYAFSNSAHNIANLAFTHANAAFTKANTALPNTSGVSFTGSLNFPTGNVGIGTASPSAKLSVSDPAESKINFLIGAVERAFVNYNEASSTMRVDSDATIILATNNTERIRIDSFGNVCIGTTSSAYKLEVAGSFAAQTKSFVINHPTKNDMKLRYGSLEGPENGVYVRGRVQGPYIYLPDYWLGLVDRNSITVSLTPIAKTEMPSVLSYNNEKIVLHSNSSIDCFYHVYAERKDVDKLIVEY